MKMLNYLNMIPIQSTHSTNYHTIPHKNVQISCHYEMCNENLLETSNPRL